MYSVMIIVNSENNITFYHAGLYQRIYFTSTSKAGRKQAKSFPIINIISLARTEDGTLYDVLARDVLSPQQFFLCRILPGL